MKKSNSLVSIIMNCKNGQKYLKESIKSIVNQNYKKWELIFYNNCSTDDSLEIVKSFKDQRIKVYSSKKNLSLYDARNRAILKARGKYICFCDVDDWWIKSKLKKQLVEIQKRNVNLVFSNLFIFNQKTKNKKLYFQGKMPNGKITQTLLDDYKLGILSVMISKKIFKKKRFNKRYNIIGDFDFFINLSLKENFYCIPKPLAYYRNHENNYSKKINIFINELNIWLKLNSSKFERLKYSLTNFRLWVYKIKVKKLIGWGL